MVEIVLPVASAVAVLALPVNAPVNPVDVIEAKPVTEVTVSPNVIVVDPNVMEGFANLLLAIAVPLQTPVVIVPSVVILLLPDHVLNAVFSTFPKPTLDLLKPLLSFTSVTAPSANFIVVIPPSATPLEAAFAET